jgi:hypothetical protein
MNGNVGDNDVSPGDFGSDDPLIGALQALPARPSIEEWLKFSSREEKAYRKAALMRLFVPRPDRHLMNSKRVQMRVAAMLRDAKGGGREDLFGLAIVLGFMRVPGTGRDLLEALAWALSAHGSPAPVDFLLKALGRQGGEEEKAALMDLLKRPGTPEPHVAGCIDALSHFRGQNVLNAISIFRDHPSPTIRANVAEGMTRLGDPGGPAMMYACYSDREWLAQREEIFEFGTPEMQRKYRAMLARQRRKWRRAAAAAAQKAGGGSHSESDRAAD